MRIRRLFIYCRTFALQLSITHYEYPWQGWGPPRTVAQHRFQPRRAIESSGTIRVKRRDYGGYSGKECNGRQRHGGGCRSRERLTEPRSDQIVGYVQNFGWLTHPTLALLSRNRPMKTTPPEEAGTIAKFAAKFLRTEIAEPPLTTF